MICTVFFLKSFGLKYYREIITCVSLTWSQFSSEHRAIMLLKYRYIHFTAENDKNLLLTYLS